MNVSIALSKAVRGHALILLKCCIALARSHTFCVQVAGEIVHSITRHSLSAQTMLWVAIIPLLAPERETRTA